METEDLYFSYFNLAEQFSPYRNSKEHLRDLFSLLDMSFTVIVGAKSIDVANIPDDLRTGVLRDLSVSSRDVGGLLSAGIERRNTEPVSEQARDQLKLAVLHIQERLKRSEKSDFLPVFEIVRTKFELDDFESFCMLLALSVEYDRKYEGIFTFLHNNSSDMYATKWLAIRMYEALSGLRAPSAGLLSGTSAFSRFLCTKELKKRDRTEISERLVLSRRVAAYLLGKNSIDRSLSGFCRIADEYEHEEYIQIREDAVRKAESFFMTKAFREEGCFVLNLFGPKGIGRGYTAWKAVSVIGMKLLRIDLPYLIRKDYQELDKYLDMIYCETMLLGAIPCFAVDVPVTEADDDGIQKKSVLADKIYDAANIISRIFRFVFWLTPEKDSSFDDTSANQLSIELPMLTANERAQFWKQYLHREYIDIMSYSNKYILTPRSIKRVASTALELSTAQMEPVTDSIVTQAVRQHSTNQLGTMASPINAVFTWDDLVVGAEQKRQMKIICDQVRYRSIVNEDWGFRKKSPYGRGLCALFYGSPGTGKTMAVQVMANELGLDLYRIDLSQLTSKYIGETQKNISALFDKAKNINAMLFFDEADSMFAKRSEVKDSNDRYANADTAFLLQKLEDHEGITILATNYVNNIDDAFKRRIKFMINFVFPDKDVRLNLWKTILPKNARVDEPLDFEFFAERFELSGSNIKEILTNAAYLAASEGAGIKNKHIIEAIKLNFLKYGKILTAADFDYLGR